MTRGRTRLPGRAGKVLLLGGCGYVGSALYAYLPPRGFQVDTIDLEWFGSAGNPSNLARDFSRLTREELAQYDSVVLLAGHSSPDMCDLDSAGAHRNNVVNFVDLLEKLTGQRFLYASSAAVYGPTGGRPATEADRRDGSVNGYDHAKLILDSCARLQDTDSYGLRFGTVNGFAPHVRGDLLINRMVATARETGAIWLSNPEVSRPVLGTRDLCRAVETILSTDLNAPGVYNLASFSLTVGEVAARVARALGVPVVSQPPSPTYDMRVSTAKFEAAFEFTFEDTVESIVASLVEGAGRALWSVRRKAASYV